MRNEFTAVIERGGEWFVAWSPEIQGAIGQGRTLEPAQLPATVASGVRTFANTLFFSG